MTKLYTRLSVLVCFVLSVFTAQAQLTGTKTIPGDYPNLAAAVSALNANGVGAGGVTISITAAGSEIAPSATGISLTATGTAGNPITIINNSGGAYVINAATGGAGTPVTAVQDGIFRMLGSDYVTLDGLTFTDNNTTLPACMEYGIGLFKASVSNGCQNNLIQNCKVNLNRLNNAVGTAPMVDGSVGILVINALATAQITAVVPLSAAGSNSNNAFYTNTIKNTNTGVAIIGYADVSPFTLADTGNDIGGNKPSFANQILNFGGGGILSASAGVRTLAQYALNVSNNIINNNDGAGVNHAATIRGIYINTALGANTTINKNTITLKTLVTTSTYSVSCIENVSGASGTTNTVAITNNTITNCTNTAATTSIWYGIFNNAATAANLTVTGNKFINNATNATTGATYHIYNTAACPTSVTMDNNEISHSYVGAVAYTGAGYSIWNAGGIAGATGTNISMQNNIFANINHNAAVVNSGILYFVYNSGSNKNLNISGNQFNALVLNHSGTEYPVYNSSASALSMLISGNIINTSWTRTQASGTFYGIYSGGASLIGCSYNITNNNFSNITSATTGTGTFSMIYDFNGSGAAPYTRKNISNNTFENIDYTTTGTCYGMMYGYYFGDGGVTGSGSNVSNNIYRNIKVSGTMYTLYASSPNSANTPVEVFGNTFTNIQNKNAASTSSLYLAYLSGTAGGGMKFYKNTLSNFENKGTGTTFGVYTIASMNYELYNNIIGDIKAGGYTSTTAPYLGLSAFYLNSGSTINITNNTVNLNTTSTGANFTSACVYSTTSLSAVNLRNNILVNTSTPKGAGVTAVIQRAAAALTNYGPVSNNNMLYAGAPSATNILYYDGTSGYQTLAALAPLAPRENVSVSEVPLFLSTVSTDPTFLHYNTTTQTGVESGGAAYALVTEDFDGQPRQGQGGYAGAGIALDMGADEFEGLPKFTCTGTFATPVTSALTPICFGTSSLVSIASVPPGTGMSYKWQSSPLGLGTFTDIAGAITTSYIATPTVPTEYRILATCADGSAAVTSSSTPVDFTYALTGTADGTRCGTGPVSLQAVGTGSTVSWFTTQTGGAAIGAGSPFNTPTISATTTYYAAATGISAGSVQLGTATTTLGAAGHTPFMNGWENGREQYLIKSSELTALGLNAGNINSLAFNVTAISGTSVQSNFTVKISASSLTAMPASAFVTAVSPTTVYGPLTLASVPVGWKTLNFTTPYNWDGSSNLLIEICFENDITNTCASCYSGAASVQYTTTSYNSMWGGYADNTGACGIVPGSLTGATNQTLRPNMIFNGLIACSSSRSPVVATVSAALPFSVSGNRTICNNAIASMDVSSTLTNFDSYIWTPVTNLYTDAAGTVAYVAGTSSSTVYVKGTTPGTTTYTCNANNTATTCADIKTIAMTILPAAVTVAATPNTPICVSGAVALAITPATGFPTGSLQWQSDASGSYANVTTGTGGTTTTYTSALLTAPTNFQILVKDDASTTCTSAIQAIQVNNPTIATTVPGTRCGTGTVTLGATPSTGAAIKWYAASTGGAALASGNTFTTPSISNSTNYFAESSVGLTTSPIPTAPGASVGGTLGSGSFQTTTSTGLFFDVLSASGSTLKSVDIYPSATATLGSPFKIDVRAGTSTTGTIIATYSGVTTVQNPTAVSPAPTIAQTVPVNFVLPQGSYNITFTTNPYTFRDAVTATATFPKTAPGVASITGATLSGYWYYFYNFVFESGCTGPRVAVLATVAAPPALTATGDQTVCNGASKTLTVTSTLGDFDTYNWSPVTNLFADAAATIPVLATDNLSTVHVKGTTAGVTAYTLNSSNTTTGCANTAPINVALLPVSTVVASPAAICVSGSTTVKVTPFNAATFGAAAFQWQENSTGTFIDISGANGDMYSTPSITMGRDYQVIIKDGFGGNVCNTPSVNIVVNSPTVLSANPATRCGTGTLALSATSDASSTLKWYGAATGGSVLGTGTTFTTPTIFATTTYYVAAAASGSGGGTTQISSNGTGTSFTATQNTGVIFDLFTEVTLNSVDIFSTAAGTCTFTIYNAAGTLLYTSPALPMVVGLATTPQTMPIGIVLQAGAGYRILVNNTGNALGYGSGVFPYPMGNGVGNIVNGASGISATTTLNYFVYNMNTSTGCASARVPVVATVTPADAVTLSASPTTICAGQSTTLTASSANGAYAYTYTPSGATGSTASVSPTTSTTYTVNAIDGAGCAASATATVAVNPLPGVVTASPALTNANIGDIVTLTATGGSSAGFGQIGTGTTVTAVTGVTPYSSNYEGARSQYLVTAAELTAMGATAGSITSLSWKVTAASAYAMTNFTIKMAPTANTVIGSSAYGVPSSPFVTVFSNPLEPIVAVGWKKYTFTAPFNWNGTSNVLIDVCHDNDINGTCTSCFSTNGSVEYTATTFNSVYGSYADNVQSCGVTASLLVSTFTNRPNMKFDYGLNAPITWTPATALYTDAAATVPYVAGATATTVYSKPTTSVNYLAVATTVAGCTTSSPAVVRVDECLMNAGISNLSVGPNPLPSQCEGLTWTYYGSGTTYNMAIEWGTNILSKNNAAASMKKFSAPPSIIVGTNATFIQPMIWNMDVAGNQPSGPVKTRIYYDPADTLAARNAAIAFLPSSTTTAHITKQVWFKSLSGEFDPSNTVFQSGIGNIEPTSVIELTPTYGSYMSGATMVHYAEFLVDHFSGGSSAISAGDLQSPLPVVFKNFKGLATGKSNTLTWEASVQASTKEYRLERSVNGRDWTLIANVASNSTLRYTSVDENPVCQAYYRVIGVDNDGKTWHTQVVTITRRCDKFNITSAYPVPTDAKATVQYESVGEVEVKMTVTDLMGRVLATNDLLAKDGFNDVVVDLSAYTSGTYFVTLNNGSDQVTQRLIKE